MISRAVPADGQGRGNRWARRAWSGPLGAGIAAGLFTLLVGLAIVKGVMNKPRAVYDQNVYHLPTIRGFADQWPSFDLVNYRSATTPGYHVAVAAVDRAGRRGGEVTDVGTLRRAGALFGIALIVTMGLAVARRAGGLETFALTAPLACSTYVFSSAGWLLPDNAGWLGLLVCLLIAWRPRLTAAVVVGGGIALLALVLVRQIHLWAAGVLWLAAWLRPSPPGPRAGEIERIDTTSPEIYLLGPDVRPRVMRLCAAVAASAPAIAAVWWFWRAWGGLVPPMFQGGAMDPVTGEPAAKNVGLNAASVTAVLALAGLMIPFYAGYIWEGLGRLVRRERAAVLGAGAAAVLGLVVCAATASSYSYEAGRFSGLWELARRTEVLNVAGRSPVMVGLGAVGAGLAALVFVCMGPRDRWLFAGTVLAFLVSQIPAQHAWQRYHEPFWLIVLGLAAARISQPAWGEGAGLIGPERVKVPGWAPAGPVVLALLLGAVTVLRV